jgi:hypothetical protein
MAKKKPAAKKPVKSNVSETSRAFLRDSLAEIRDEDVNAYAMMVFSKDKEKWSEARKRKATEATLRFANLGWAFFHVFGEIK